MPTTTTDTAANSIGALLKTTREQRGLTQSDVASQLNLKVVIIEKLEAEQWDTSMATTFVKGYLRAYARLLKLSEREILQAFDLQTAHLRSNTSAMHSFSRKTSREAADSHFMLATYGIVVLLVGLFLVWFWQTHLIDAEPVAVLPDYVAPTEAQSSSAVASTSMPSAAATQASGNITAEPSVQSPVVQPNAQSTPAASASVTSVATPTTADVPTSSIETTEGETPSAQSTVAGTADSQPVTAAQQLSTDSATASVTPAPTSAVTAAVTQPAVSTAPASTDANVANSAPTAAAPVTQTTAPSATSGPTASDGALAVSQQAELQLSFSQDCWLSVIDASQQKVAYGLQKAGTSLKVMGQYPLKLTIGNASAATLQVQGKAYDLSQYKAGQVARITLTGAE